MIDKAFDKWIKNYLHKNNYDPYIFTIEQMKESWNASRIDTLIELEKRSGDHEEAELWDNHDGNYLLRYIDTELKKGK